MTRKSPIFVFHFNFYNYIDIFTSYCIFNLKRQKLLRQIRIVIDPRTWNVDPSTVGLTVHQSDVNAACI